RVTADHAALDVALQARHLQAQFELIGPEPRHLGGRWRPFTDRACGETRLLNRVLHALESCVALIARQGPAGAVPDREDRRLSSAGVVIDDDAVVARETGIACQRVVAVGTDADQDYITGNRLAVAELYGRHTAVCRRK